MTLTERSSRFGDYDIDRRQVSIKDRSGLFSFIGYNTRGSVLIFFLLTTAFNSAHVLVMGTIHKGNAVARFGLPLEV